MAKFVNQYEVGIIKWVNRVVAHWSSQKTLSIEKRYTYE